jgi:glycerate dehydrogenase
MNIGFLDFDTLRPADLDTSQLEAQLEGLHFWPNSNQLELSERLKTLDVVIVNKARLNAGELRNAPQLKLICLAATGTDNVDITAARECGIAVCNIRDYCTPSVVQHVFSLILALTQNLDVYKQQLAAGDWQKSDNFCLLEPPIRELAGKTIGLVGLGALGSGVAAVARAFNMRVIAAQLPWRSTANASTTGQSAPRVPLEALFAQADIVSLHCPLTTDTQNIIDATALAAMKSDALLINTARGGLVDSEALLAALENNDIGGAGIDVLPQEPPVDGNVLLNANLENLIVTPHIAWSAREARQRALDEILENILAFQAGNERNRII